MDDTWQEDVPKAEAVLFSEAPGPPQLKVQLSPRSHLLLAGVPDSDDFVPCLCPLTLHPSHLDFYQEQLEA